MPSYTVKSGDTLSKIAQQVGYGSDYRRLASENSIANPNVIRAGQVINYGGGSPAPSAAPAPSAQAPNYSPYGYNQPQQQSGPRSASDLIAMGYHGYAGWDDAGAIANFNSTGGQGKGGPSSSFTAASRPTINIQEIYDRSMNNPDIFAAQEGIKVGQEKVAERRRALAQAEADINDNPFYSEATRVGRIAKLQDRANADIGLYQNDIVNSADALTRLKADAGTKIDIALKQHDIDNQAYQQSIQQFNMLLEAGGLNNATASDLAQIAQATGISTTMLKSMVDTKRKASEPAPQLQTYDDGQQQYILAVDAGGNIVNRQVIGASKPTKTGGGGGGSSSNAQAKEDKAQEAAFYKEIDQGISQLQKGAQWGTVWNRIKLLFPDIDNEVIDTLLGPEWRSAGAYQSYRTNTSTPQYDPTRKQDNNQSLF